MIGKLQFLGQFHPEKGVWVIQDQLFKLSIVSLSIPAYKYPQLIFQAQSTLYGKAAAGDI